jgi:hypothetical protein
LLRGKRSPGSGGGIAASPASAGSGGAAAVVADSGPGDASASRTPTSTRRYSLVTSRAQRKPKRIVIAAPTATAGHEMISPTRIQTMPIAKPTGQRLGGGRCGFSSPGWGST